VFSLAALAIGVALLGRVSDGYVLWVVPPWRVELSFNLFVLAQACVLAVLYLFVRAVVNTLSLPRVVADYRARRARRRDTRAATDALRQFWEGRYAQALKSAEKVGAAGTTGEVDADATAAGVAALVALKSAHALRDERRSADWQARAAQLDAGWRTARLMAEMRIALDARDFAGARAALEQLAPQARRQIAAQRLALRLAQGQGDWAEMLRLTRQLEKHKALTAEQAQPLRLRAHRGMLDALQDEPAQLMRYWQEMPAADRLDPQFVQRAAKAMAAVGACAENAQLIEDTLDERWESDLLEHYACCPGGDALGRIAHCEKWLHEHPADAALLLALGRLCAQRQLWGKAQSYLEASLAVAPSCAAHIELARLCDTLERPDEANRHYRAAAHCQLGAAAQIQSRGGRKSV
jgi:HemY protein